MPSLSTAALIAALTVTLASTAGAQPRAGTLIVLNKAAASASLIDAASGRTVATVPVGQGPHEVAVSPDGRLAVVSNYGEQAPGSSLTVIDISTHKPVKTISVAPHHRPHGIAWIADTHTVAVTTEVDSALMVVDLDKGVVQAVIPSGQRATHMVALSPDGRRAYTANIASGSMTAMDLISAKSLGVVPTGAGNEGIAVTPDGREVWTANRAANTVSVVDAASLRVVATIPSESFPIRVKITPDGHRALVTNAMSSVLRVFDVATRRELATIAMPSDTAPTRATMLGERFSGPTPVGLLITPDGKYAFVANTRTEEIAVVDLTTLRVVATYRAGSEPDGLGWSPLTLHHE